MTRQDTQLVQYIRTNGIPSDETLNLNEIDFKMAFYLQGKDDNSIPIDPKFSKIIIYTHEKKANGQSEVIDIPYHKCS